LNEFYQAKSKVGKSKFDDRATFKDRLLKEKPFTKIIIFVDNSGADIVLGILPLCRYFLKKGSRVVLAANTFPSVNDVTAQELEEILQRVSLFDENIRDSVALDRLKIVPSGSGSPCISKSFFV
jgi:hypothetical protein